MQWSIDSADAYSVAKVRHCVIDELRRTTGSDADLFRLETVLGELLSAEMERGHRALVVSVERAVCGPAVHLYLQGMPQATSVTSDLREAILRETRVPMSVEISAQGAHICLRVPMAHERSANPKLWKAAHTPSNPARER